jgi:hypothetical protein
VGTALRRDIEAAESQTVALEKTIALVEGNRARFKHIDNVRAFRGEFREGLRHSRLASADGAGRTATFHHTD